MAPEKWVTFVPDGAVKTQPTRDPEPPRVRWRLLLLGLKIF